MIALPSQPLQGHGEVWRNWSGGQSCRPAAIERPTSVSELSAALKRAASAGQKVRVAGSGHSFSELVPTDGRLILLDSLTRVLDIDRERGLVRVEAGIRLHDLNRVLAENGLAMVNLGDIDAQTVAGAISTATHGTGVRLPNLSAQVEALELVCADGSQVHCSAQDSDLELFRAARVSMGSLGVISAVTLRCVPTFNLHAVEGPIRIGEALERLDELVDGNDHFEFFAFPYTDLALTRTNRRTAQDFSRGSAVSEWFEGIFIENYLFGTVCRLGRVFPGLIPPLNRLVSKVAGRAEWVDRSDRVFATRRLVRFEEMEYAIPRESAAPVIREVLELVQRERLAVNFPIEVRFVAPDDAFLSPATGRATCYVAVHVFKGMPWEPYFRAVETIMNAHAGRPHWGKRHFQTAATLAPRYPEWERFQRVRARLDPGGLFATPALERVLGPVG